MDPWSRGREVARGVLRSSPRPEKRAIFCHRRGIENFCRLFSTQQRPNMFVSDSSPAPATYHRSFCEHCDQRVGRSPQRARPIQISRRSRWFSHFFFFGVFEKFETFFSKIFAHSERHRNLLADIFEVLTFYGNIALPLAPVLVAARIPAACTQQQL